MFTSYLLILQYTPSTVACKTAFTFTAGTKFHCATFTRKPLHTSNHMRPSAPIKHSTNHATPCRKLLFSGRNICYQVPINVCGSSAGVLQISAIKLLWQIALRGREFAIWSSYKATAV